MKKVQMSETESFARLKVIGVGGSGKNITNHMIKHGLTGVEFIVANTDSQDLQQSKAKKKIHLGRKATRGLGTGMNPVLGQTAAEEVTDEIVDTLKGADMVFITCGMGGGTATGAAPVIAKIARNLGILTVAVVTKPFSFEGAKRLDLAEDGLQELANQTDSIVIIPNDRILTAVERDTSMAEAFALSDDVHLNSVRGIAEIITTPGYINVDFADIRTILENAGVALMGVGCGRGANRVPTATQEAISSPLLETNISGARRVLFAIASPSLKDVKMQEVQDVARKITESVDREAKIIFGTSVDKSLRKGEIRVTVLATSFNENAAEERQQRTVVPSYQQQEGHMRDNGATGKMKNGQSDMRQAAPTRPLDEYMIEDESADIMFEDDEGVAEKKQKKGWSIKNLWGGE